MAVDINYGSLLYFLLFMFPVFYYMRELKINLIKPIVNSLFRMTVQLLLVGLYLQYIFNYNNSYINTGYILFMSLVAVYTISKDIALKEFKIYWIIFAAVAIPLILNLFLFNVLALKLADPLDAMYLIPISGMILGNTLNGLVVALSDFLDSFTKNEEEYFLSIAMGATKKEAVRPYIAKAVSLSVKPNIASMATIGLVSLPGMMTGQILGGSLPMVAIKYQIAIMTAIFTSRFFSTYILLDLISRNYFDKFSIFDKRIKKNIKK